MEGPSPPDQDQPLALPKARSTNPQASTSSQVQPDPSKSGEIEAFLVDMDEYKHLINRNRSREAELVDHNRAKESDLYQRIVARGLKGHGTSQQERFHAPEAEQHTELESNLGIAQNTEQGMERNARRDLATTQKTGQEARTASIEIIDLGSSSESDDQEPIDHRKRLRKGVRTTTIKYPPDHYSSSVSSGKSTAKRTQSRDSTTSTIGIQNSLDLNTNTYHERRPTAERVWWSIPKDEWDEMQRKLQVKWSIVGWIMETDAGKPAASLCGMCKKLGAECRVITRVAAEKIGESQAESLKCARCRAWQRYCSLQGPRPEGESSGTSGPTKIEQDDTKAPVPKIPSGALQSSTSILNSRSTRGKGILKRTFIDLSDEG